MTAHAEKIVIEELICLGYFLVLKLYHEVNFVTSGI